MTTRIFHDRRDAGRRLAERLRPLAVEHPVVIALPRGGVPVAFEVAEGLSAPLDVLVVRKVGAPGNPEFGIGAVAEGGVRVLDGPILHSLELSSEDVERAVHRAEHELEQRRQRYRSERPQLDVTGKTVILVDDGVATGGTARAALRALRARQPARLVFAVPVGAAQTVDALASECDGMVCLIAPQQFAAVGHWYEDFQPTTDAQVDALLEAAGTSAPGQSATGSRSAQPSRRAEVTIPILGGWIATDVVIPDPTVGIVLFAHGSGSSRQSPRNRQVAAALNDAGFATLLIDLLTLAEERERANVFDVALLADRLGAATRWVRRQPGADALGLGYFGASTGAGAALWAAAETDSGVRAVVSRGGRPDLAGPRLAEVRAPTLLIVGGLDDVVIELNREALSQFRCEASLQIVPGATHLFEEPGTLERVVELAVGWFTRHLVAVPSAVR